LDWAEVHVEGVEKYIKTDLSQKESIDNAFQQIPQNIDSFFGIAGVSGVSTDFLTTTKIDLISNKYICEKILINRMQENSSIAFMTSTAGIGWEVEGNKKYYLSILDADGWDGAVDALSNTPLIHLPGNLGYSFSKLAMNYLVAKYQSLFASKKIRVNAVLPGSTDTGLKDDFTKLTGGIDNLLKYTGYAQRLALPEEMAAPIVFLNSKMASYTSGELLVVDYGSSSEVAAMLKENPAGFTFEAIIQKMTPSPTN
jgi:NAD(P)-dependent dehydrogenase (short-subunit alcohol dehydrogenase family)